MRDPNRLTEKLNSIKFCLRKFLLNMSVFCSRNIEKFYIAYWQINLLLNRKKIGGIYYSKMYK